ncbi:MAG: ATP-binding protein [Methanomethylovorans sp.]|uniref:ATP-binding protein n=1 Tax=Methanomethylovorans sp. TaxID=2758717 RepID=UPI0035307A78
MTLIGKVIATEKNPTTIDDFCFWTDKNLILNPFDVVKVEHINGSNTFAVIEEISHITDSASFLSNFISSDFGDVNATEGTHRIGMNYVKSKVVGNDKNIFIPVQSNSKVYLATKNEVAIALGLNDIRNPLACGYLEMYENVENCERITLPVNIDSNFLIGPEGAHLNISGISGLAAKTSYAMFLLKSIQDKQIKEELDSDVAFVVFNVKGKDLLAIDEKNDFGGNKSEEEETKKIYEEMLRIDSTPFENVTYLYPYSDPRSSNTHMDKTLLEKQLKDGKAFRYKFDYKLDKDNLELMFANIDDPTQSIESILNYIINNEGEFGSIEGWKQFLEAIDKKCVAGNPASSREITVQSWRKFYRLVRKSIHNNPMFSNVSEKKKEVRIAEQIAGLKKNHIYVIDIAKLDSDMQAFVFGHTIRELYNLQLGDKGELIGGESPSKIIVFIDELNKFASSEVPKSSPILKQLLDIAERGRSLGIILFGAEQFKSALHKRVSGNCSTFAFGRTNAIELATGGDYTYIPPVYKGMMTRLKQGEYIIQNPVFRSLLNVKFPKPLYKQFK